MIIGNDFVSKTNAFGGRDLSDFLDDRIANLREEIRSEEDEYTLGSDCSQYLNDLVERYRLDCPELHVEGQSVDPIEKQVPRGWLGTIYPDSDPTEKVRVNVMRYYLPISGDLTLIHFKPSPHASVFDEVALTDNALVFDIVQRTVDPASVTAEADQVIRHLVENHRYFSNQIREFNDHLEDHVKQEVAGRKEAVLKQREFVAALGVPVRVADSVPTTFKAPAPKIRRKIVIGKPKTNSDGLTPEFFLEVSVYDRILEIIRDGSRNMEQYPSIYLGKGEEQLRDLLLFILQPNIEASVSGEAFNKRGKTDILIKHEGKNVFVAECKFWTGEKSYLRAINQLLGYLTWRDSKVALVIFVQNRGFEEVLEKVGKVTPTHSNYLRTMNPSSKSHLNYRFHLKGDEKREVWLAVQLFHLPPVEKPK